MVILSDYYLAQKKVARMILFSNYNTHGITIFKQLNILPLNKFVVIRIGIMMYRYDNHLLPLAINDLFTTNACDVHNYTTRQKHLLHVNKSNINIYSKSFRNTSARIWNAMQAEIEVHVLISKFRIYSKIYLQEHTLHLNYTKSEYCIMYCCSTILFYYYLYIIIMQFHLPFYFVHVAAAVNIQNMHISLTDNISPYLITWLYIYNAYIHYNTRWIWRYINMVHKLNHNLLGCGWTSYNLMSNYYAKAICFPFPFFSLPWCMHLMSFISNLSCE